MPRNPPPPRHMTRNSVPPPPPPTKRFKKDEMKVEVIVRDYDGQQFVKYSNSDGYHMMKLSKHGKLDDVMGEELDAIDALLYHAEQERIEKVKLQEDAEKQKMVQKFYAPYVPLILDESKKYTKQVDSHRDQLKTLTASMKKKIVNDKLLEENRRLAGISDTQFKKDADPPKKKQKETVEPELKPEVKPEYGEVINIRKKKSRWERLVDRIIKNIVWGK